MIENLTKTIAYICPYCSGVTQKQIGVFRFSGDRTTELLCSDESCTEPCVTVSPLNDKYKITVDCPVCGEMHTYKISKPAFWNEDIFTFQCPNSGIDIFFFGTKPLVTKAVDENNAVLEGIADSYGEIPEDLKIILGIIDDLHKLLSREHISCKCGCKAIIPKIDDNNIALVCPDCGNKLVLPATPAVVEMLSGSEHYEF